MEGFNPGHIERASPIDSSDSHSSSFVYPLPKSTNEYIGNHNESRVNANSAAVPSSIMSLNLKSTHSLNNDQHSDQHIHTSTSPTETIGHIHQVEKLNQNNLIHLDPVPNFKDKSDIKPWLQKIFYPQGIELVIERSDTFKVVFKCKAAKRGRNARRKRKDRLNGQDQEEEKSKTNDDELEYTSPSNFTVAPNGPQSSPDQSSSIKPKKKRCVSRFNNCPFRVRATYSLKRKRWSIVVMNNNHSHLLKFNPDSEEYKKFKEKLRRDNDVDAIKKFDELEYRTLANLPIPTATIPCDCGLTNEIQSFNVVLPTNSNVNSSASSSTVSSISLDSSNASKRPCLPPVNSTGSINTNNVRKPKSQCKNKDTLLKRTTMQNFLTTKSRLRKTGTPTSSQHSSSAFSGYIDDPFNLNEILPLPASDFKLNAVTNLNEIDFTNIFTKSPHPHSGSTHPRQVFDQLDDCSSILFSPLTTNTNNEFEGESDDFVHSPYLNSEADFSQILSNAPPAHNDSVEIHQENQDSTDRFANSSQEHNEYILQYLTHFDATNHNNIGIPNNTLHPLNTQHNATDLGNPLLKQEALVGSPSTKIFDELKFLQNGPHGSQHPVDFQHVDHRHLGSNEPQVRSNQYGPQPQQPQYPHNQSHHGHSHGQHQEIQREVQAHESLEIMGNTLLEEFKDIKMVNGELKYVKRED
ncbi:DNA-binding transcription factor AFT1 [Saccharomyces paradoxus]|uniref:DNA-binding transcription factor AFT1 n=1 Tax=Saccharomyces paradoxus TaxID=27291 RepID=A0A8B8URC4_SACPA|nr:Aft1 [Saccharomyces paradoxus]QHS73261.1 Aft1 [Saccharomyces paradoxus]